MHMRLPECTNASSMRACVCAYVRVCVRVCMCMRVCTRAYVLLQKQTVLLASIAVQYRCTGETKLPGSMTIERRSLTCDNPATRAWVFDGPCVNFLKLRMFTWLSSGDDAHYLRALL